MGNHLSKIKETWDAVKPLTQTTRKEQIKSRASRRNKVRAESNEIEDKKSVEKNQ